MVGTLTEIGAHMLLASSFDAQGTLQSIMNTIAQGVFFIGAAIMGWGFVQIGIAVFSDTKGGGAQIVSAFQAIVAGAIIMVASAIFGGLPTAWVAT